MDEDQIINLLQLSSCPEEERKRDIQELEYIREERKEYITTTALRNEEIKRLREQIDNMVLFKTRLEQEVEKSRKLVTWYRRKDNELEVTFQEMHKAISDLEEENKRLYSAIKEITVLLEEFLENQKTDPTGQPNQIVSSYQIAKQATDQDTINQ